MLPQKFKQRYRKIIPEFDKFLEFSKRQQSVSARVNTLKTSREEFLKGTKLKLREVPWYENGFFVDGKQAAYVTNTLEYFLGYIYLQDAASMIPPLVLDPQENERILDMTSAPGSKTTQIAQMLNNRGCIIANDNSIQRIKALRNNINRLGVLNVIITNFDSVRFPNSQFDKILLDVPCSLEGSMRKYFITWNENIIRNFAGIQRRMIERAFHLLKPDGILVYSTCTYAPEENEGVVQHLMNRYDVEIERIKVKGLETHPGLERFRDTTYDPSIKKATRIYIHDYNTSGFFIAKIRKLK
ncbi:MAG: NOL1/NOP2/sun family putative RNA methylase [Nanoarchaeota archaeon]